MQDLFEHFAFKAGWSTFLACSAWVLGGFDVAVLALFILYAVDFGLGLYRAWMTCSISSEKFRRGMGKFILYVIVIMCAHMLDLATSRSFPFLKDYVRDFIIIFVAITEFLSVCTHLAALGLRVPEALQARLRSYRDTMADCPGQLGGLAQATAPPPPTNEGGAQ